MTSFAVTFCPQQFQAIEPNMAGAIPLILMVILLLFSSLTDAIEKQSDTSTSKCAPFPPSGMLGIPGVPGIPGTPGAPGRDGFKGEKGSIGLRGSQGAIGIPGKIGPRGPEGSKGEMGEKGSSGIHGNIGPRGLKGSKGENGTMGTKGSTGTPGNTGPRGLKGFKGDKGLMGTKGSKGIPGNTGLKGLKGSKGERGLIGAIGSTGTPGNIGPRGLKGSKGENGIGTKGEKGDAAVIDPRQRANWKQCAWRGATDKDEGKIKECSFNKLHNNTALRVSYQGNVRVYSDRKCNRWYFKFNGNECSGPLPIESILYINWAGETSNILRHHSFDGYCENLARGTVSVELWVGKCSSQSLGDAVTGWNSVSRIMIEEVPPSQ